MENTNIKNNVWVIRPLKGEFKSKVVLGVDLFHPNITLDTRKILLDL
jgi:hypothetical protein